MASADMVDTSKPPNTSEDTDKFRYSEEELQTKRNNIKFLSVYDEVNKLRFNELCPFDSKSCGKYTYDWECDGHRLSVSVKPLACESMVVDDPDTWVIVAAIRNAANTVGTAICSYYRKSDKANTHKREPSSNEEYILEINDIDIETQGVCVWWVTCTLLSICSFVNPLPGNVEGFVKVASQSSRAGPCYVRAFQILNFKIKKSDDEKKDGLWRGVCLYSNTHSYQMAFYLDVPIWKPVLQATGEDDSKTLSLKF